MATHSSVLAWRIPWTEEPGRLLCNPWGCKESSMTEQLSHTFKFPSDIKKSTKIDKQQGYTV